MLPAAIDKFEELLADAAEFNPVVASGYNVAAGRGSFAYWGAACRMQCADMGALKAAAEALGITWLSDDGDMVHTNGLSIDDFQTYRVNGNLELTPEKEGM
jgi:hypothetical protein